VFVAFDNLKNNPPSVRREMSLPKGGVWFHR
jgi:hypothetical protein